MLVLSRRVNQKIVFPGIQVTVSVVRVQGGVVRLGIEAPPEVTVLREEVADRAAEWTDKAAPVVEQPVPAVQGNWPRQVCGRLKDTGAALGLVRLLLDAGAVEEAKAALITLQDDVRLLRYGVEGELEPVPPKPPAAPRKPLKALLVEDDHNQRELLAGFLRLAGVEVDTAGDGADALDYLHSHCRPDFVLLDMGLPRVDGPTMVREIRRDPLYAGLKIFGVSGRLPTEFDLESGAAGVDRWFHKPLDPSLLVEDLTSEVCGV